MIEMYEDFIAERVNLLRKKMGVSAREMSIALGQNPTYISQIESGKTMPSVQGLFAICRYFEITPKAFFDTSIDYPVMLSTIVREARTLDDTELFLLQELARKFNKNKASLRENDSDESGD